MNMNINFGCQVWSTCKILKYPIGETLFKQMKNISERESFKQEETK